jgi:hypothetical protein
MYNAVAECKVNIFLCFLLIGASQRILMTIEESKEYVDG